MERHRNWIKLKVVLSAMSIMSFCAVWSYLSMIEATGKTTKVGTSDGTHTSSLDSLAQKATYRQANRHKASLVSSNNSSLTQPSTEEKGSLAITGTPDKVSSDNPQEDAKEQCTSSECRRRNDKKRTKQHLGMLKETPTDPQGNSTLRSHPRMAPAELLVPIRNWRKKLKGHPQQRPYNRSRKIKGRTRRDTLSAAIKPSNSEPSGLASELQRGVKGSLLEEKAETRMQRAGESPPVPSPDQKSFRTGRPKEAEYPPAKPNLEPSGSSSEVDRSTTPSHQTITGRPTVDKSVQNKPEASKKSPPRPSLSSSSDSLPHMPSNYLLPVHVTHQPSSGASAHLHARTIPEEEVHSTTSPPGTTPRQRKTSVTMPHKVEPKVQRTKTPGVHSTHRLQTQPHPSEGALPEHFKGSSPPPLVPTKNSSDVQDIEERTSGSECRNGLNCNPVSVQRTDDAYWAFGSLLTILLLLTGAVLYTGLWKKRNHMSNPISDVNCHVQAQASPVRKTNIRDLLKHKLSHIKNLNNSPLSLGKADWNRRSNGSSSGRGSNGRYLHRYDRLPLLVRDEDDEDEEEEFSREWGPKPAVQTCGV